MDRYINTILRELVRCIFKSIFNKHTFKVFIILCICALLWFCFNSFSWAVYTGDQTYTDKNIVIYEAYESITSDLINRLSNSSNTSTILSYFKNPAYNYYYYYGNANGSSMINASTLKTDLIYVVFFSSTSPSTSSSSYDTYQGLQANILTLSNISEAFFLEGDRVVRTSVTSCLAPSNLLTYKSSNLIQFLNDNSASQNNSVVNAIEEQTNTIEQQTTTIQQQTNTIQQQTTTIQQSTNTITDNITSTDYDESTVDIDTSASDSVDDSSSVNLFTTVFTNFSNLLNNTNWNTVETIDIGIPFANASITLRSDILSNIVKNTMLETLINVAWYSLFGLYVFRFSTKIYHSIKDGSILGGISFNDEVITSTML